MNTLYIPDHSRTRYLRGSDLHFRDIHFAVFVLTTHKTRPNVVKLQTPGFDYKQ
jgi:hypothetical protein